MVVSFVGSARINSFMELGKKRLQFCERVGIGTPNGEGKNKNANVLLLVVTLLCLRLPLKRAKSSTSLNIPFSSILFFIWSSHSLILLPPVSQCYVKPPGGRFIFVLSIYTILSVLSSLFKLISPLPFLHRNICTLYRSVINVLCSRIFILAADMMALIPNQQCKCDPFKKELFACSILSKARNRVSSP